MLVPLTNSLYVKGELSNTDSVLVDVGTGFLIEKVSLWWYLCGMAANISCVEVEGGGAILRRQGAGVG